MKRAFCISIWILTATVVCSAQTTFYYPHVANGVLGANIWKTTIFLTNPAASGTASGTITFSQDNSNLGAAGSAFSSITFIDQDGAPAGSGGFITVLISCGEARKNTWGGRGAVGGEYATATTGPGIVRGPVFFPESALGGGLTGEAGVPSATAAPNQAIFVDTQGGFSIGVAYANAGPATANVTL